MNGSSARWKLCLRVFLFLFVCACLLIFASAIGTQVSADRRALLIGSIAAFATLLLTLLFVRWDGVFLADVGTMPGRRSFAHLVGGFFSGLILVALQTSFVMLAARSGLASSVHPPIFLTLTTLLTYFALACREELAFHGYPLFRLKNVLGIVVAQLSVALVFAMEHKAGGYSWTNALLGAFTGSLLFGMAAITFRGLAWPIGMHAAWNFGQWIIGKKDTPGFWHPIRDKSANARVDQIEMLGYLIVFSLAILGLWTVHRGSSKLSAAPQCRPPSRRNV